MSRPHLASVGWSRRLLPGIACLAACLPGAAPAQQPKKENVRFEGELQGAQQGLLQVVTAKGDQWLVKPPEKADQVMYSAMAEPAWLRPGLIVRFLTSVSAASSKSPKFEAALPVRELTVFTPQPGVQMGVVADSNDTAGLFEDRDEKPRKVDPKAPQPALVAGKLMSVKNGVMTIGWGPMVVTAQLADDAKIAVEVADLSLLRPGDKVEVQGWYYEQLPGRTQATQLKVTSPEPLKPVEATRGRGRGRGKQSQGEQDPDKGDNSAEKDSKPGRAL